MILSIVRDSMLKEVVAKTFRPISHILSRSEILFKVLYGFHGITLMRV